jgi:hypothetical protein
MNRLKDFKNIADEAMKDIIVSEELKAKTLVICKKNKPSLIKTPLLPAACIVILIVSVISWRLIYNGTEPNKQISKDNNQDINIMKTPENNTLPLPNDSKQTVPQRTTVSVELKNLAEAKSYIRGKNIEAAYIPKGFQLTMLQGVSYDNDARRSLWIQYTLNESSFVISIEDESQWKSVEGYKDLDVNGATGHMKHFKDGNTELAELRWFVDKDMYTVEGNLSEEEALKVAKALK